MLHVFIFHGFKSTAREIAAFDFTPQMGGDNFPACDFINSDWYAGPPYVLSENSIQSIFMLTVNAAVLHDEWNEAVNNLHAHSDVIARQINQLPGEDTILFVGHSMGAELIARIILQIRHKIDLYLFLMAGMTDRQVAAQLLADDNIVQVINFLSERDFMLRKQLPEFVSTPVCPVGLKELVHHKAVNYRTTLGHSEYLRNEQVLAVYGDFIRTITARA